MISLPNRNEYYIVTSIMNQNENKLESQVADMAEFRAMCSRAGIRITPQRIAVYLALVQTSKHPSADSVFRIVRKEMPNISFDTVNRTLNTFTDIGAAFVVEGSGDVKRFDANLQDHQHFKCIKCKRIIDFHHKSFDNVYLPQEIREKFTVLRKTVYIEGICDKCSTKIT